MEKKEFPYGESVKFGWETFKKNTWYLIGISIVYLIIQLIPNIIGLFYPESTEAEIIEISISQIVQGGILVLAIFIVTLILQVITNVGIMRISIAYTNDLKPLFKDLFQGWDVFWKFIGCGILVTLLVLGGLFLLIIPGIIWAIKYSFAPYLVVEGVSPVEALKKSGELTKGYKWDIFLFGLLVGLINVLGMFLFFVGILVALPVTLIAYAYVYKKLKEFNNVSLASNLLEIDTPSIAEIEGE